jgi:hypothetical protein
LRLIARFTAVYSLWLISSALALIAAYFLIEVILDLAFILKMNPWQLRAIRNFGTVIIGLLCFIYIIGSEGYFRKYISIGLQMRPILVVFAVEVVILLLAYLADSFIL